MRVAVVGLGSAGSRIATAVGAGLDDLVGAVDIDPDARAWFEGAFGRPTFDSIDALCDRLDVDVAWIATPTARRETDTASAARRGAHVIVDKPIAADLDAAERMITTCERAGVMLVSGGSRSTSACVRTIASIVDSGQVGDVRAITALAATDWVVRPRRPDELDETTGGGVVLRQAPHLVDTCRLLAGGTVSRVRAVAGNWIAGRGSAPGYFSAILEMASGVTATCTYNGYGYFTVDELVAPGTRPRRAPRRDLDPAGEADRKRERLAELRATLGTPAAREPFHPDLGLMIVHCERGDIRTADGRVVVYGDGGVEEREVPAVAGGVPELDELREALAGGTPLVHSGRWGVATLEVCLGISRSARERRDVHMTRQLVGPG